MFSVSRYVWPGTHVLLSDYLSGTSWAAMVCWSKLKHSFDQSCEWGTNLSIIVAPLPEMANPFQDTLKEWNNLYLKSFCLFHLNSCLIQRGDISYMLLKHQNGVLPTYLRPEAELFHRGRTHLHTGCIWGAAALSRAFLFLKNNYIPFKDVKGPLYYLYC